jgi:hypothetical protein
LALIVLAAGGIAAGVIISKSNTTSSDASTNYTDNTTLSGITCLSSDDCWAIGQHFNTSQRGYINEQTVIDNWNGSAWSTVPSPSAVQGNSTLASVSCVSHSSCFAVGQSLLRRPNYGYYELILHWNGMAWSLEPSPISATTAETSLSGIQCFSSGYCFAVGKSVSKIGYSDLQTLVEEWNGSTWSVIPSPNVSGTLTNGLVALSCTGQASCVAVGEAFLLNNIGLTAAERWNGVSWTMVNSASPTKGINTLDSVSCATPSTCFAVGDANTDPFSSSGYVSMIQEWNGVSWQLVPSPNTGADNNLLQSVSCPGASLCFAVGDYQPKPGESTSLTLIEKWNGTSWSVTRSPNGGVPAAGFDLFNAITCVSPSDCLAVGSDPTDHGNLQTLVAEWNGTAWSLVPSPDFNG